MKSFKKMITEGTDDFQSMRMELIYAANIEYNKQVEEALSSAIVSAGWKVEGLDYKKNTNSPENYIKRFTVIDETGAKHEVKINASNSGYSMYVEIDGKRFPKKYMNTRTMMRDMKKHFKDNR